MTDVLVKKEEIVVVYQSIKLVNISKDPVKWFNCQAGHPAATMASTSRYQRSFLFTMNVLLLAF